jgi:hypothetical protein
MDVEMKNYLPALRTVVYYHTKTVLYAQLFGQQATNLEKISHFITRRVHERGVMLLGADQQMYSGLGAMVLENYNPIVFKNDIRRDLPVYYFAEFAVHNGSMLN